MLKILISGTEGSMDNYVRAIENAGAKPCAMHAPLTGFEEYDGLILAGGGDISPERYGEVNEGLSVGMDIERENSDILAADAFVKAGKPILGICRGMQTLNVLFGGTMIQDLGEKCAVHTPEENKDKCHKVNSLHGSLLHKLYGNKFTVNSAHHQAVREIAEDFCVTVVAEDGTVEAIEHKTLKIVGVQWHPERCDGGEKLIDWFVEACIN